MNPLICLSHLRWNFVFQRPQHLMTRCSKANRVFFWEEPIFDSDAMFVARIRHRWPGVRILLRAPIRALPGSY